MIVSNEQPSEQEAAVAAYNQAFEVLRDCYKSFISGYKTWSEVLRSQGKDQAEINQGIKENEIIKKLVGIVVIAALKLQDQAVRAGQSKPVADIDLALKLANEYGVSIIDVVKLNVGPTTASINQPQEVTASPVAETRAQPGLSVQEQQAKIKEQQRREARQQAEDLFNQDKIDINQVADLPGMTALRKWLDEVGDQKQHAFHDFTLQKHTQELLDRLFPDCKRNKQLILLMAGALHDIGKVGADLSNRKRLDPEGRGREPRHTERSAEIVSQKVLPHLDWLTQDEKEMLLYLVAHHDWLGDLAIYKHAGDQTKQAEVYRGESFGKRLGRLARETKNFDNLHALFQLTMADIAAVKAKGQLLSQEKIHQLSAAYFETLEQMYLIAEKTQVSENEKEKARIFATYSKQMARINRHERLVDQQSESVFNDVAPTHRCGLNTALGILESGVMVSAESRGINFRVAGLGAGYGYITFIGRSKDAAVLHPETVIPGTGRPWSEFAQRFGETYKHPLNIIEMAGVNGATKVEDIFQNLKKHLPDDFNSRRNSPGVTSFAKKLADVSRGLVGDFHDYATIPACASGQFNIGFRNEERVMYADRIQSAASKMRRSPNEITGIVPTEAIGAMLIPDFLRSNPEYANLVSLAKQRGIEVIVTETGQTALDYLGESAAYLLARGGSINSNVIGDLGQVVAGELSGRYKQQVAYSLYGSQSPEFEDLLKRYLLENRYIQPQEADYPGNRIRHIIESQNEKKRLNRGSNFGGQYINVVGQRAYLEEQQAYFSYLARVQKKVSLAKLDQSKK